MSSELMVFGWSVALLVAHIALQGALVLPLRGLVWNAGPRDEGQPPLPPYAGRAQRALGNFKETYPAFVGLILALVLTTKTGGLGEIGAYLWLAARVVYLPLYLFGVPWFRSAAFGTSLIGLLLMAVRLFA